MTLAYRYTSVRDNDVVKFELVVNEGLTRRLIECILVSGTPRLQITLCCIGFLAAHD